MLLIDSSAIVKYLSKESDWEAVIPHINDSFTMPLALVEIGSAFAKKLRDGEMDLAVARELLRIYSNDALIIDQNRYVVSAFEIAIGNRLSIYDSLFVAAALGEGCNLASCDEKQMKVAEKLGVKTIRC